MKKKYTIEELSGSILHYSPLETHYERINNVKADWEKFKEKWEKFKEKIRHSHSRTDGK